jgi:hypothetical protein
MINAIKLQALRNGEYIQLMLDIVKIIDKKGPDTLQVAEEYTALKDEVAELETLFKIAQGNLITDELIALDARRDNAITGIQAMVTAFTYSTLPEQKQAAQQLELHLGTFGSNIARDNYQSQTTVIRNIIDDWTMQPNLQAAVSILNLGSWLSELEAANTLFADKYLDRAEESGRATPESIRLRRETTNTVYYALRDRLNAFWVILKGAEPYGSTIQFINGLTTYYNSLLNRRATDSPNAEAEPAAVDATV